MAFNKWGEITRAGNRRKTRSLPRWPVAFFQSIFVRRRINLNVIYWSGYWLSVVVLTVVFNEGFSFDFSNPSFVTALALALLSSFFWPVISVIFVIMWLSKVF